MIETMDAVMFARLDAGIAAGFHESVHGVERVGGWMFSLLHNQSKGVALASRVLHLTAPSKGGALK